MSTIYTLNGKVLKNNANDKWLIKKEAPAGFVMNASNAVSINPISGGTRGTIVWESPTYPEACNLDGKTVQVKITENITANTPRGGTTFMYAKGTTGNDAGGPNAALITETQPGIYTYTCANNPAPQAGYGVYLSIELGDISDKDKIELTILD